LAINTLPLNLFFPTHSVLFPSALLLYLDGTVYPAEYASMYRLPCDFNVVYCINVIRQFGCFKENLLRRGTTKWTTQTYIM
jgi:hypothetical protein